MFEFIHEIMEAWILRSTDGELSPLRRALLNGHLKRCGRCRSFMLDLVEFSHSMDDLKGLPRLSSSDMSELHARVMAAFEAERLQEKGFGFPLQRAQGPRLGPGFLQGLALASLLLVAAYVLWSPYGAVNGASQAAGQSGQSESQGDVQNLLPLATPVSQAKDLSPSASPQITPTPPSFGH
jgi:hypothetical protein